MTSCGVHVGNLAPFFVSERLKTINMSDMIVIEFVDEQKPMKLALLEKSEQFLEQTCSDGRKELTLRLANCYPLNSDLLCGELHSCSFRSQLTQYESAP